jgi:5-methylcytosine-specific restriction endonuclease McrA
LSVTSKDTYLRNRSKKFKPTGNCEVCGEKAYCQHHITPLYNGGTNQFMNRINICRNCHVEVHTWMIPDTPKEIRDMDISFSKTIS